MQMFDLFIFTETWINSTIKSSDLKIVNFKEPFRCDRESRSGGVAIYVKDRMRQLMRFGGSKYRKCVGPDKYSW